MNNKQEREVELAKKGTLLADFQKLRTDAISEMFDNVDEIGIYPTSRFFRKLDDCVEHLLHQKEQEVRREVVEKISREVIKKEMKSLQKCWAKGRKDLYPVICHRVGRPFLTNNEIDEILQAINRDEDES